MPFTHSPPRCATVEMQVLYAFYHSPQWKGKCYMLFDLYNSGNASVSCVFIIHSLFTLDKSGDRLFSNTTIQKFSTRPLGEAVTNRQLSLGTCHGDGATPTFHCMSNGARRLKEVSRLSKPVKASSCLVLKEQTMRNQRDGLNNRSSCGSHWNDMNISSYFVGYVR